MSSDGLIFFQYLAIFNTDNLPYSNKIFAKVGSIFSKCKLSSTKLSKTFKNLLSWQDFTEYGNTGRIAFRRKVLEKVSTKADSSFTKKYFSLVQRFLCRIRFWSILSEEKFWKREKEKKIYFANRFLKNIRRRSDLFWRLFLPPSHCQFLKVNNLKLCHYVIGIWISNLQVWDIDRLWSLF